MATLLNISFPSFQSLAQAGSKIDTAFGVTSALEWAQAAWDNQYLPVASRTSASSTSVSGRLSNGDTFSEAGTNLLGFPYTVTQANYHFLSSGVDVALYGSVSYFSATTVNSPTGFINRIE